MLAACLRSCAGTVFEPPVRLSATIDPDGILGASGEAAGAGAAGGMVDFVCSSTLNAPSALLIAPVAHRAPEPSPNVLPVGSAPDAALFAVARPSGPAYAVAIVSPADGSVLTAAW